MRRFDYSFLKERAWDNEIVGYLSQIHELKGKQTLYLRQKPADVEKLIEIARIQSTESDHRATGKGAGPAQGKAADGSEHSGLCSTGQRVQRADEGTRRRAGCGNPDSESVH